MQPPQQQFISSLRIVGHIGGLCAAIWTLVASVHHGLAASSACTLTVLVMALQILAFLVPLMPNATHSHARPVRHVALSFALVMTVAYCAIYCFDRELIRSTLLTTSPRLYMAQHAFPSLSLFAVYGADAYAPAPSPELHRVTANLFALYALAEAFYRVQQGVWSFPFFNVAFPDGCEIFSVGMLYVTAMLVGKASSRLAGWLYTTEIPKNVETLK